MHMKIQPYFLAQKLTERTKTHAVVPTRNLTIKRVPNLDGNAPMQNSRSQYDRSKKMWFKSTPIPLAKRVQARMCPQYTRKFRNFVFWILYRKYTRWMFIIVIGHATNTTATIKTMFCINKRLSMSTPLILTWPAMLNPFLGEEQPKSCEVRAVSVTPVCCVPILPACFQDWKFRKCVPNKHVWSLQSTSQWFPSWGTGVALWSPLCCRENERKWMNRVKSRRYV